MRFTKECFDAIQKRVNRELAKDRTLTSGLEEIRLTDEERRRLKAACPYFPDSYLDFLASIKLDPRNQVKLEFLPTEDGTGEISCRIEGPWRECILYEIPVMAISEDHITEASLTSVSESYFEFVDTDWSMQGQFGES